MTEFRIETDSLEVAEVPAYERLKLTFRIQIFEPLGCRDCV
jgi:hypothetical protein